MLTIWVTGGGVLGRDLGAEAEGPGSGALEVALSWGADFSGVGVCL